LPANQAPRSFRPTASSFIASKRAPTARRLSIGTRLARESGGAVFQAYRVIVHREQARSYSSPHILWERCLPAIRTARSFRPTASLFIASKLAPTVHRLSVGARLARESGGAVFQARRVIVHREQARSYSSAHILWERCLPANQAARSFRPTASSFIAGKLAPTARRISCGSGACPRIRRRGLSGLPRHRSSQASSLLQLGAYPVGAVLARDMGGAVLQAFRVHNQPQSRHFTDAPQTAPQTVPLPDRYPGRRYGLPG